MEGKKIRNRICLLEQFSKLSESHTAVRNTELRTTNICFPKRPQPELLQQRQCIGIARSGNGNHVLPGPLFSCVLNRGDLCLLLGQFVIGISVPQLLLQQVSTSCPMRSPTTTATCISRTQDRTHSKTPGKRGSSIIFYYMSSTENNIFSQVNSRSH